MLEWLARKEATAETLMADGRFLKAAALLRKQFEAGRRDPALREELGLALLLGGSIAEAVPILLGVADELARTGLTGRAIAALKKVEAAEPGRKDVATRLAALVAPPVPEPSPVGPAEPGGPPVPRVPLFTDLDAPALEAVARGLRLLTADPGDIVVAEGEPGGSLYIVTSGVLKAFVKTPRGRYAEVRQIGEGEFFGEISVLDGSPRTATVTAASRCELLRLDAQTLETLTTTHPVVRETLTKMRDARKNSSEEALLRGLRFGDAART
jgi:hypothetical protein